MAPCAHTLKQGKYPYGTLPVKPHQLVFDLSGRASCNWSCAANVTTAHRPGIGTCSARGSSCFFAPRCVRTTCLECSCPARRRLSRASMTLLCALSQDSCPRSHCFSNCSASHSSLCSLVAWVCARPSTPPPPPTGHPGRGVCQHLPTIRARAPQAAARLVRARQSSTETEPNSNTSRGRLPPRARLQRSRGGLAAALLLQAN